MTLLKRVHSGALFNAASTAGRVFSCKLFYMIHFVLKLQLTAAKAAGGVVVNGFFLPFLFCEGPLWGLFRSFHPRFSFKL